MSITYNLNIPNPPNDPGDDVSPMQVNTNSVNSWTNVDHVEFNSVTPPSGYHTVIHQVLQSVDPGNIVNVNQVYQKNYTTNSTVSTTDTQLFSITGSGIISQLTGQLTNGTSSDGWCWVGGILIQWGVFLQDFSSGSTKGTLVFKDRVTGAIPFPTNCFIVIGGPIWDSTEGTPGSQASLNIDLNTIARQRFGWQFYTNSSDYEGFYWIALGN
ncbi:hypothetical protein UFOVP1357_58 [uncultured Caudovirales phage]|uniref:Putative tail fiber protein gp53-like C-terminal domain-containing protein n=1 Tax=uncultured Caudovirales phage TaxID=2100421 RepID=A0A6J5KJ53_9CAUD|nr:hypothetical protein UFOVP18_14 [uncultured Caudovirales phage]CAB4126693.1 hypothetical protein UFOVP82_16 [uncultured Caudovirales phage]CAB4132344.1 hypothetical protein UFOVP258_7 [uncultured Caudovirales phage]CAB4146670.1 hypothetical protein UFOVP502_57 [uncultured Caudovirales phage]CAB4200634.1 hypothetical protein UFOVP1357_58 [uncultured Caudovirales phage]